MNGLEQENIITDLRNSVQSIVQRTGENNAVTANLLKKIEQLQSQLDSLTEAERYEFINQMRDSFRETISTIEQKLQQYMHLEHAYNNSILTAVIFIILFIFALFGYKLYKSLMEKELKKQEKQKLKQSKKAKKAN